MNKTLLTLYKEPGKDPVVKTIPNTLHDLQQAIGGNIEVVDYKDGIVMIIDKGSDYAAEGTEAHALCGYKLRKALGMEAEDPTENLSWFNQEMDDCATGYAAFILELVEAAKETCADPVVLIEQRLDYSKYVKSGFGTGDCVLISGGTLHIVDFKYGRGVQVDAEDNPQMKLYALGALEIFDCLYEIKTVSMTIYQPRRANISTFTLSRQELVDWAETVLAPTAELAYAGDGDYHCGEWCQFCKAKADCRERARVNLELARYDFKLPPLLTDEDIEDILSRVDDLVSWASDIKEYDLQQAIGGQIEVVGYKDGIVMLCDEEGYLYGLRENVHGVYGPIVVCRVDGEDFASLKGTEILDLARKDFAE